MKQPQNTAKTKRKSREEIDAEAKERKRAKKRRGNVAGARTNVESNSAKNNQGSSVQKDPRVGSKKPVPLIVEGNKPTVAKPKAPKKPKLSAQQELDLLENDERLNQLLDAIDEGKNLSEEDQDYVDSTLDRIDALMVKLGIDLGEDEDDDADEEQDEKEDIVKLLKRNSSKE
ncbi:Der GTPase-activating protein YihI [Pragia fontium]|uniref:Der GTPase-activating protein YihI n=1 Tax=Pragia fontium TaxID=82985 RepID=UPI000E007C2F|nr:Der GTPase-activating protein YihI [Pragia fontium]SUB80935.1 Der GTPase-activating protein YihI [Pragia fontium]